MKIENVWNRLLAIILHVVWPQPPIFVHLLVKRRVPLDAISPELLANEDDLPKFSSCHPSGSGKCQVGCSFLLLQVILYVWRMVSNQKKNKEKQMFHTCSRLAILQTTSTHRYLSNKSCVFFLHKIRFHHRLLAQKKTMPLPLPSKQSPSIFTKLFINFLFFSLLTNTHPKYLGKLLYFLWITAISGRGFPYPKPPFGVSNRQTRSL